MWHKVFAWLGFGDQRYDSPRGHGDRGHGDHASAHGHNHTHGVVDPVVATTAVPLWVAFLFARRSASARFTYGFGRVEDLAGVLIVLIIFFSAVVAGYEAVHRLMHPQPMGLLGWVAAAGVIGFVGNEWVVGFRIRVGR